MKTNRNIVDMVKAIRKDPSKQAGGIDGTYLAMVTSVSPLTIKMYDTPITENIYLNQALMVGASDSGDRMEKVFHDISGLPEVCQFLKEFHEKFVVKAGDTVVVHVAGSSFYIAGKAVQA